MKVDDWRSIQDYIEQVAIPVARLLQDETMKKIILTSLHNRANGSHLYVISVEWNDVTRNGNGRSSDKNNSNKLSNCMNESHICWRSKQTRGKWMPAIDWFCTVYSTVLYKWISNKGIHVFFSTIKIVWHPSKRRLSLNCAELCQSHEVL